MRKLLCIGIALLFMLAGCSAPAGTSEPGTGSFTYGIYELTFNVEQLSGWPFGDWDFVYTYDGEVITGGHRVTASLALFSFQTIQVDVIERDTPTNVYSTTLSASICDGGSGKTEVTVTGSDGRTAVFRITCNVTQIGKR